MRKTKKLEKIREDPLILIVGIPGPGLIGILSVNYVIHSLKMDIVGEVESPEITSIVFIENGEIFGPIRIYKKGRVFAVLSDIPIDYGLAAGFSESIIEFAKKNQIDMIIIPSGIHTPDRHVENIKTFGLVTDGRLEKIMYENDMPKFLSGMIAGPDAVILSYLKNSSVPALILYTECNFFFPDPEAAMHTIKTISKIVKKEIDLVEFKKQINFLRLQGRQLMEDTLSVLQQQEKEAPKPPQIYK